MKDDVREAVRHSFICMLQEDGSLFDCPIEEDVPYDARKLHEVCINHKLANHLEHAILPLLTCEGNMFVDIEFNREGLNYKKVQIEDEVKRLRPDIIIHNRRSDQHKRNFLIVECKNTGSTKMEIDEDRKKIHAMMEDDRYAYSFGLQVLYGKRLIEAVLFYRYETSIESEKIVITSGEVMQPNSTTCS